MALTASDMCARTGAHILYCVLLFIPFSLLLAFKKNMFFNMFINQRVTKKFLYSVQKIPLYIWLVCYKVLLLHPLSRTGSSDVLTF